VAALHDHDEYADRWIVQPRLQNLVPGFEHLGTDHGRIHELNVVGVVDHDDVGTEPGDRAKRHGAAFTAAAIAEMLHGVPIKTAPLAPARLIPVAVD
jgi:hypothetical protein